MSYSILIVDDSATTRAIIKRSIQLTQIPTDRLGEAADGQQALQLLAHGGFDLVLADLNMPEMGGMEMTRRMQANPITRDIPVVIISAEPNAEKFAHEQAGVRGCLRKPFTPEAISNLISQVLGGAHG